MPTIGTRRLASLRTHESTTVQSIPDEDPALLRYLGEVGIVPEARVTILDYSELDGNLTLRVEGRENIVLGTTITNQIFIEIGKPTSSRMFRRGKQGGMS